MKISLFSVFLLFSASSVAYAESATWNLNPPSSDWNTASNWTPNAVPNGPDDVATFVASRRTLVTIADSIEVNGIAFGSGASPFTITSEGVTTLSGFGVTNESGVMQNFVSLSNASVEFTNSATAGTGTFTNKSGYPSPGMTVFHGNSSAASGVFTNENGGVGTYSGAVQFYDNSTAASATIINDGGLVFWNSSTAANSVINAGVDLDLGQVATMAFIDTSTAGEATVILGSAQMNFSDSASAGNSTIVAGSAIGGSTIYFQDMSTADHAIITANHGSLFDFESAGAGADAHITINPGTSAGASGGVVAFGQGSAGNSTITVNGAAIDAFGGSARFSRAGNGVNSSADNSTITVNGASATGENAGGFLAFNYAATAGNATLIANGGTNGGNGGLIKFNASSTGGTSRVETFGNGYLEISLHLLPGVTVGSIEGDGSVQLGPNSVTVGSNNLSTTFSGVIQDGGSGGSLNKIGTGRLILTNANTYTGGTTVNGGTLLVNNITGSGLGAGPVQAISGILGGSGVISGRVTMGTGHGTGTTLGPGANSVIPGTLTIGKQLALKSDATYRVTVNSNTPAVDLVIANGVRILGAQVVFNDVGSATLPPGTVFTVISNTSSKPISGTFANLADGGTITVGANTLQANYEGGAGNDLTLTVVP